MTTSHSDNAALEELDFRIRLLLPEEYQDSYESMRPTPMGAAGLTFDCDGRVAWDQIWGSFCDLAIAGGPPHKGALLEPGDAPAADRTRYDLVVSEICRGITMVTGLPSRESETVGWIEIECPDPVAASWLVRAIVVENVAVHADDHLLYLPAAARFRLEKEIKNVVTVMAKTSHYWMGHMSGIQRAAIGRMLDSTSADRPLLAPAWPPTEIDPDAARRIRQVIDRGVYAETGRGASGHSYATWIGIECPSVAEAVWMMRALVASNVLSRREGGTVFLPIAPEADPDGSRAAQAFIDVFRLSRLRLSSAR